MQNIYQLHGKPLLMDKYEAFEEKLQISDRTHKGQKNGLNVWDEWSDIALNLPSVAMDSTTIKNNSLFFASTFDGASALCSFVLVHDYPQIAAVAPFFVDGHAVWISKGELEQRLKNTKTLIPWLREGFGACARQALDMPQPSELGWNVVSSDVVRAIVNTLPNSDRLLTVWNANTAQDAWRYASALAMSNHMIDINVKKVELDCGWANQNWQSSVMAWDCIHQSALWQQRRINKSGSASEVGRLLAQTIPDVELQFIKPRFTTLLLQSLQILWSEDEKLKIIETVVTHCPDANREDLTMIATGLAEGHQEYNFNISGDLNNAIEAKNNLSKVMQLFHYIDWMETKNNASRVLALASGFHSSTRNDEKPWRDFLKQEVKKIDWSSQQLNVLSQWTPWALEDVNVNHADSESIVFAHVASSRLSLSWEQYNGDLTVNTYSKILKNLIINGWADNSMALDTEEKENIWMNIVDNLEGESDEAPQAVSKLWPQLIDAACARNALFASQMFGVLLNKTTVSSNVLRALEDKVNWSHQFNYFEKRQTLAEATLIAPEPSFKIKALARRALEEMSCLEQKIVVQLRKK